MTLVIRVSGASSPAPRPHRPARRPARRLPTTRTTLRSAALAQVVCTVGLDTTTPLVVLRLRSPVTGRPARLTLAWRRDAGPLVHAVYADLDGVPLPAGLLAPVVAEVLGVAAVGLDLAAELARGEGHWERERAMREALEMVEEMRTRR